MKAQRIHRELVDAMRMLQMSHDGTSNYSVEDSGDEAEEEEGGEEFGEANSLEFRWQEFVKTESRKRQAPLKSHLPGIPTDEK